VELEDLFCRIDPERANLSHSEPSCERVMIAATLIMTDTCVGVQLNGSIPSMPSRHTARLRTSGLPPSFSRSPVLYLLYLSTSFLWWQVVVGLIGGISSNALRNNSRCRWRHRAGARNVDNTAICRAFSPLRPCGSVPAAVHGCPRGVALLRPSSALRDTPMARPGGATTPSPPHATGGAAHLPRLCLPPDPGLATTRYASEPMAIIADERNRERGRQEVYCRCACCLAPDSVSGSKEK
jgi:hypothetical protein